MTKSRAHQIAHLVWYKPPNVYNSAPDRKAQVVLRPKRVELRCEVGYYEPGRGRTIAGSGRTWEEAFAVAGVELEGMGT
jgi:hypothetical protein